MLVDLQPRLSSLAPASTAPCAALTFAMTRFWHSRRANREPQARRRITLPFQRHRLAIGAEHHGRPSARLSAQQGELAAMMDRVKKHEVP